MSDKILVAKLDEVHLHVSCDDSIAMELSEYFKFRVPGYQFMPDYKNKLWNGFIYLFSKRDRVLYIGLLTYLEKFAKERQYDLFVDDAVRDCKQTVDIAAIQKFLDPLKLPHEVRDYQEVALKHAVENGRSLLLSPTASGKSLIIYTITQWYKTENVLLIVPTVGLVTQMISDFGEYGLDTKKHCHGIYEGQSKQTDKRIVVSTWQSIYKMPKEWFAKFKVVIGDEAHLYKADSIKSIMEKLSNCKYRFGTTGTLDGSLTNKLVLEGLFGPVFQVTTSKKLMDEGHIAKLKIDCILLKYTEEECRTVKKLTYQQEIGFLLQHQKRNTFITNLASALKGNTLVLFQYVEKHGKILHESIQKKVGKNKKVFYVHGGTDADTRENIRKLTEKESNAIIVASVGVFSTGVNIKNIENIIFVAPSKSRVRTLQSIGRGLRVGRSDKATLYDIVDDLSLKAHKNYALKHFIVRAKIYDHEKFDYKVHKIDLGMKKAK